MRIFGPERSRACLITVHVVFGLLLVTTLALVFGYFVMLLWNNLLPEIFAWPRISYCQGVGLLLLARLLTGGLGHCKAVRGHFARREGEKPWMEYENWWKEAGRKAFSCHCREKTEDNNEANG